jgi:rhodanese-related sulfurtransferase
MKTSETDDLFIQFARITSALAAPSRLKLVDRLCQGEQTVEQLAAACGLSLANTSRHLRVLAEARLVASRRSSPYVYYRLADEAVSQLWGALRDLAGERLAEIDRSVAAYLAGDDSLVPIRRDDLLERLDRGDVVLLDVRPLVEYRAGHLPGAVSIPLDELAGRIDELPAGRDIVAYCRGPYCFLSVDAVRALRAAGRRAGRLGDGVPEWRAAGLPVEAATS